MFQKELSSIRRIHIITSCLAQFEAFRNNTEDAVSRDRHSGRRTDLWTRSFSAADHAAVTVTYEQVKKLLVARSGVVIDVREPWELREYGGIPGSINVPLGQVSAALQLKPEEFKEKYGGEMPMHLRMKNCGIDKWIY
ncbi:hypothetical protein QTP70_012370 [Hemibagrus guttatus]|uniref:Rhodanese domain-containing protein n=1 Tax=Hemibagrus guttatus TaxID=175788 RepID=A0AAE0Q3H5_9TELE|nr:hypothetical protein QTP70_012370 [Hemibagrus guttatus]